MCERISKFHGFMKKKLCSIFLFSMRLPVLKRRKRLALTWTCVCGGGLSSADAQKQISFFPSQDCNPPIALDDSKASASCLFFRQLVCQAYQIVFDQTWYQCRNTTHISYQYGNTTNTWHLSVRFEASLCTQTDCCSPAVLPNR